MTNRPAISCWKLIAWPEIDRALWEKGCTPAELFEDGGYGAGLRTASLDKVQRGYGRWLCFLASRNWLNPTVAPIHRLTRERLAAYFSELREAGNADFTIIGRFSELALAMKILSPGQDISWIRRPNGLTIRAALPRRRRALLVPDIVVLADWGFSLMRKANEKLTRRERLCAFRDGLLITILAHCARRLRSMSLLRVGHEFRRTSEAYRIDLSPSQVKTNRADEFRLPDALTSYIDHYLGVVRPGLLGGRQSDALWISDRGQMWSAKAIQSQMLSLTRKRFGSGFGPHRFRHAIATSAPRLDPMCPGLAASVLDISPGVTSRSYNRCDQFAATRAYQAAIVALRAAHTESSA